MYKYIYIYGVLLYTDTRVILDIQATTSNKHGATLGCQWIIHNDPIIHNDLIIQKVTAIYCTARPSSKKMISSKSLHEVPNTISIAKASNMANLMCSAKRIDSFELDTIVFHP